MANNVLGIPNYADTIVSYIKNENSAQRVYTLPDRDGEIVVPATSLMYPGTNSIQAAPINPGTGGGVVTEAVLEMVNIGNPLNGTENRHRVPGAMFRMHGSVLVGRNIAWDQANTRFYQPYNTASDYGTSNIELGGAGVILGGSGPVAGTGAEYINTSREIFKACHTGLYGTSITTGQWIQSKAPMYMRFSSSAYVHPTPVTWNETTGVAPMIWLHAEQLKNGGADSVCEYQRLESNYAGQTGAMIYFKKSRGSISSKVTSNLSDIAGALRFSYWDGAAYQATVQAFSMVDANATSGNAPGSFIVSTSATNAAGLAQRFRVWGNGNVLIGSTLTSANVTALLQIDSGGTTKASLRISEGSAPASPNDGEIWKETTNDRLMYRKGASSEEIMSVVQVNSVSPTAPDRTVQLTINGTTLYIHAKTTND